MAEKRETAFTDAPETDKPINGPRRHTIRPLLITVLVFAALIGLYILGVTFLVPAD